MADLNEEIKKLSKTDPLVEAEKITGQSYKTCAETSMIGFSLQTQKSKMMAKLMDETNDTKFGDTLKDYIFKITTFGFEKVLQLPFMDGEKKEHLYVFFEPTRGILLVFDTYYGDRVNGGHMYYNWATDASKHRGGSTSSGGFMTHEYDNGLKRLACFDENFNQLFPELPLQIYNYSKEQEAYNKVEKRIDDIIYDKKHFHLWTGNHDCREAVIHNISQLENYGHFVPNWKELDSCIFLTHYMDWKDKGVSLDIDTIVKERMNMLPEWVQIQIGFKK